MAQDDTTTNTQDTEAEAAALLDAARQDAEAEALDPEFAAHYQSSDEAHAALHDGNETEMMQCYLKIIPLDDLWRIEAMTLAEIDSLKAKLRFVRTEVKIRERREAEDLTERAMLLREREQGTRESVVESNIRHMEAVHGMQPDGSFMPPFNFPFGPQSPDQN